MTTTLKKYYFIRTRLTAADVRALRILAAERGLSIGGYVTWLIRKITSNEPQEQQRGSVRDHKG
jgi:hypothetical protein